MPVVWQDPPARVRRSVYDAIFEEVREGQGKWALIAQLSNGKSALNNVTYLRTKYGKEFEVISRQGQVYARLR